MEVYGGAAGSDFDVHILIALFGGRRNSNKFEENQLDFDAQEKEEQSVNRQTCMLERCLRGCGSLGPSHISCPSFNE